MLNRYTLYLKNHSKEQYKTLTTKEKNDYKLLAKAINDKPDWLKQYDYQYKINNHKLDFVELNMLFNLAEFQMKL